MSAPPPVRLIQVGLGLWGRDWALHVLPKVSDVRIVARVDGDDRARRLAVEAGVEDSGWHRSLDEALEHVEADAVLATVAIAAHTDVALAALGAGKHVLLEKPFAATLDEARRIAMEAEKRHLVLSIAQNYRFFPGARILADQVQSRSLGLIDRGRIDFRKYHLMDARISRSPLDHSFLTQISIHHFDLLRAITGREPSRVYCRAWNAPWVDDVGAISAAALLDMAGGAVITYTGSLRSSGPETGWAGDWRLECEGGEISWITDAEGAEHIEVAPRGGAATRIAVPAIAHGAERAAVLAAFVEAVRNGTEPPSGARDNLRSLAVMTAAIESAQTGQPVAVPRD